MPDGTRVIADVCIIGAGAAGITLARELAVFPTSGSANPALTIVASPLRLAQHLGHRLRSGDVASPEA